jgi:hypothetical protein
MTDFLAIPIDVILGALWLYGLTQVLQPTPPPQERHIPELK